MMAHAEPTVDPITVSVIRGMLESTQREMTLSLEKTARSSVFNLAHDYSTAIFNHVPEMVLQGEDIPIHLGSLMPAMKAVARYFGADIHPGDLIVHNDPTYGGSHGADVCLYKPIFYGGELRFWTVCKGHLTDIGGPVPASYNPNATEIYAECLRIPPVKIRDKGVPRSDVMNLILTNIRARRDQEGDFNALIGACHVGERSLLAMIQKYGIGTVDASISELMRLADEHMRSLIRVMPDGKYSGTAILEDAGHGFGEIAITATVTIRDDECHIAIDSPPQVPYFINSYAGNSHSGVYLGLMMVAQLPPPYNEGLYRCVTIDFGPEGTLCNASEPAPHMNCTTTPMETLTDAVRLAFEKAMPSKAAASWGHSAGINISGWDARTGEQYVTMVLASAICGAGATVGQDGWHACGPECVFGAVSSGDVELLEYSYPIVIKRYEIVQDSGGAGTFRGGCGTAWEAEPLSDELTYVAFGEGRIIPAPGAAGARSAHVLQKVGRIEVRREAGMETYRKNVIGVVAPGESITNYNPGGGGYGNPFLRAPEKVLEDVVNGFVSVRGARDDYGVEIVGEQGRYSVDAAATTRLRQKKIEEVIR